MSPEGAVLVRPDGFVAWRTRTLPSNPERSLEQVISSILCRLVAASDRSNVVSVS
jgi:putative polyketide hydroxylase